MPARTPTAPEAAVKRQIVDYLKRVPFERAIEQPDFKALLEADAVTARPLYPRDALTALEEARQLRHARRSTPALGAFFSNKSVVLVPGFMGSQLRDDGPAGNGLIWIDPTIYTDPAELSALRLAPFADGEPDHDAGSEVAVHEDGAVPILYAGLKYYLESGRCEVRTAGFDWRKDIDESAALLAETVRSFAAENPQRPLFVVAHSQGSLVARRALQLLGRDAARRLVNRLILLGPASFGTFSAAFAVAGSHSTIDTLAHYGLRWPDDLNAVLQSMSGLYQMIPWKPDTIAMDPDEFARPAFWQTGVDADRLRKFFRWAASVDTEFFNDRTSIILGDDPQTPAAAGFVDGRLATTAVAQGDGTVTDDCALLPGVVDLARAPGASHMTLPLNRRVMQTVWRVINANLSVLSFQAPAAATGAATADGKKRAPVGEVPEPVDLFALAGVPRERVSGARAGPAAGRTARTVPAPVPPLASPLGAPPPPPPHRRLRVFSFDPLLATDPEAMGMESIVLKLDWDDESADGAKLQPGPVGEYLEVVDYDPASRCFYPPVDLNHPSLLAQDGMPLSETDPRFHQQMVYAVGMQTIAVFERALGRSVLWAPHLPRDEAGRVIPDGGGRPEGEFVRRLRVYPHALRDANAYYDPQRKALLFGYFPARTRPGDKVLPKGTVFTCLSYDVVAHEMTHALLDGMHRHLLDATNPDVLAFHEAFADVVALFQHFSHPDVVRGQVARVAGRLQDEGMLGQLAQQFGEAMGMHGSLRSYLGRAEKREGDHHPVWRPIEPDPTVYQTAREPHDRGALLVAALFTAFLTIYRSRTRDLIRIATGGSGIQPPGDLHPDLVGRLADEAAKAARHLLVMAVRALDYLPPVDITFGDYLRALVTGDADLVPGDRRLYRLAVVDAFRQWGIYPQHVRNLSVQSLVWGPPESASLKLDLGLFRELLGVANGSLKIDRGDIYRHQRRVRAELHDWMRDRFAEDPALAAEWGLDVSPDAPATIARDDRRDRPGRRLPRFDVHSVRRCRRVGPDEQERIDILVEIVQRRDGYLAEADQAAADAGKPLAGGPDFVFRGGCTLIIDPRGGSIRYAIRKSIRSQDRLAAVRAFHAGHGGALGLRGNYFGPDGGNPFPYLHATED
jgi:hypothetical protein